MSGPFKTDDRNIKEKILFAVIWIASCVIICTYFKLMGWCFEWYISWKAVAGIWLLITITCFKYMRFYKDKIAMIYDAAYRDGYRDGYDAAKENKEQKVWGNYKK